MGGPHLSPEHPVCASRDRECLAVPGAAAQLSSHCMAQPAGTSILSPVRPPTGPYIYLYHVPQRYLQTSHLGSVPSGLATGVLADFSTHQIPSASVGSTFN